MTYKTILKYFFLVIPPFKPGAGSAEAGIHASDSRFRGNDERVESQTEAPRGI